MMLNYPNGEFTIAELENANNKIEKTAVRTKLAEGIAKGRVEVVNLNQRNQPPPLFSLIAKQRTKGCGG
jgi:hypothetical protein